METKTTQDNVRQIKFPCWKRKSIIKFAIVFGMAATGTAMMAGGLLAWIVGEKLLLLTRVSAGAIFIAAGGLGLLKCLDGDLSK